MKNKKAAQPRVSIVILNWNGIDDTLECLESVRKLTYQNYEIIVVDNGSRDDSIRRLRDVDGIKLVESSTNTGFAGGHNIGYTHATGDYIALLNNDLVVDPEWLSELVNCATAHDVDIVGGRAYDWTDKQPKFGRNNTFSSYQTVSPITGHTAMLHRGDQVVAANNLSGSNLLVSRRIIEKIGYLDSDFFCYYEETDFIARAKRAGFSALYCPRACVWHKSGASSRSIPFFYFYQMHRNRFWFAFKNYDRKELRKFISFYTKEMLQALRSNSRRKNLHDSALIKAFFVNLTRIPTLLVKRRKVRRLGHSYNKLLTRASEGFDDITVIVPCYNYAKFVGEALTSLENQKLKPTKVIIIDDGSTDDSVRIIKRYIDKHNSSSINYQLISKKNEGVIKTKNMALKLVETNWMMYLDADDTLSPDYLFECVSRARFENSDIVYTDMQMFGSVDTIHTVHPYNRRLLRSVNIVHNSALMRTAIFKQVGGYKERMSIGFEDWELYLSISEITSRFSYIDRPLFYYRRHDGASRDVVAQNKLPLVIQYLEELHPNLYNMRFFWWLELYRAKNHVKELVKLPLQLARHTKSHIVKKAEQNPDNILSIPINKLRKYMKKER